MTIFARNYINEQVIELAQHADGRVGIWSPTKQQWCQVWGAGRNHAGFIRALLDWSGHITPDGEAELARRGEPRAKIV